MRVLKTKIYKNRYKFFLTKCHTCHKKTWFVSNHDKIYIYGGQCKHCGTRAVPDA